MNIKSPTAVVLCYPNSKHQRYHDPWKQIHFIPLQRCLSRWKWIFDGWTDITRPFLHLQRVQHRVWRALTIAAETAAGSASPACAHRVYCMDCWQTTIVTWSLKMSTLTIPPCKLFSIKSHPFTSSLNSKDQEQVFPAGTWLLCVQRDQMACSVFGITGASAQSSFCWKTR